MFTLGRFILILLLAATSALAHMSMVNPPPFRHATNPYTTQKDSDYRSPLGVYPCKGYHKDLGTPAGRSVASYQPGKSYTIELEGSAVHDGGSCQIALSYDQAQSFSVIQSYIGNCVKPVPGAEQKFAFTIPKNAPKGEAILAWTWFNTIGNREMYMNCAAVTIGSSSKGSSPSNTAAPLFSKNEKRDSLGPPLFKANIGNGCSTIERGAVEFPNPGNVVRADVKILPPVGNCGSAGAGKASDFGSSKDSSAPTVSVGFPGILDEQPSVGGKIVTAAGLTVAALGAVVLF